MNLSEEQVSRRRMSRVIEKPGADWVHPQQTFKYLLMSADGRIATAAKREVPKQS